MCFLLSRKLETDFHLLTLHVSRKVKGFSIIFVIKRFVFSQPDFTLDCFVVVLKSNKVNIISICVLT